MTVIEAGRTLYVSDLDGTLLGRDGMLAPSSRDLLEPLLADGLDLTIATARSFRTARRALGDLPVRLPHIAYSGATAIDPADAAPLWWDCFDVRVAGPLVGAAMAAGVTPLVFWLDGDVERIGWVRGAETAGVDTFVEERAGDPRLAPVDGWNEIDHERVFFVSIVGEHLVLRRLQRMIRAISWGTGCSPALQPGGDLAVLDITAATATKATGARRLADLLGYDRLVAFGDGVNDLPLFAEADESYAVADADAAVQDAATGVIGASDEDGVARFLAERVGVRTGA